MTPVSTLLFTAGPAPGSTGNPITDALLQYGVLGIAVVALGWVVLRLVKFIQSLLDRERDLIRIERERADRAEARVQELHDTIQRDVIPVVTRVTAATDRQTDASMRMAEVLGSAMAELRRDRRG